MSPINTLTLLRAAALLILALFGNAAGETFSLPLTSAGRRIEIVAKSPVVELGQKIPVRVRFWNEGAKPWKLDTPARSGWVSGKGIGLTHQQAGFDDWYIRRTKEHKVRHTTRILLDNPISENYSFGFSLGDQWGFTTTLPDGTEMTAWGLEDVPEIEIEPNEFYEFELDLFRMPRSTQERKQAPHLADPYINVAWRPGPWSFYVAYGAGKPTFPVRIQSPSVKFSVIVTEKTVDHWLQVVESPGEGNGPREWASNYLWLLKPNPAFDWPRYDATQDERDKAQLHNRRVIAEFEAFWKDFKGTRESREFLRGLNAAFGIDAEILDLHFAANRAPGIDPNGQSRNGAASAATEPRELERAIPTSNFQTSNRTPNGAAATGPLTQPTAGGSSRVVWSIALLGALASVLIVVRRRSQMSASNGG